MPPDPFREQGVALAVTTVAQPDAPGTAAVCTFGGGCRVWVTAQCRRGEEPGTDETGSGSAPGPVCGPSLESCVLPSPSVLQRPTSAGVPPAGPSGCRLSPWPVSGPEPPGEVGLRLPLVALPSETSANSARALDLVSCGPSFSGP